MLLHGKTELSNVSKHLLQSLSPAHILDPQITLLALDTLQLACQHYMSDLGLPAHEVKPWILDGHVRILSALFLTGLGQSWAPDCTFTLSEAGCAALRKSAPA